MDLYAWLENPKTLGTFGGSFAVSFKTLGLMAGFGIPRARIREVQQVGVHFAAFLPTAPRLRQYRADGNVTLSGECCPRALPRVMEVDGNLTIKGVAHPFAMPDRLVVKDLTVEACPGATSLPEALIANECSLRDLPGLVTLPEGLRLKKLTVKDCPHWDGRIPLEAEVAQVWEDSSGRTEWVTRGQHKAARIERLPLADLVNEVLAAKLSTKEKVDNLALIAYHTPEDPKDMEGLLEGSGINTLQIAIAGHGVTERAQDLAVYLMRSLGLPASDVRAYRQGGKDWMDSDWRLN
jgi:hypothetical protein